MSIFLGINQVDDKVKINNIYNINDVESWFNQTLTTINDSTLTTIDAYAFQACSMLYEVNFPVCTFISNSAFCSCSSLQIVNFPQCVTISSTAFGYCSSLQTVNFPQCTTISNAVFALCRDLRIASFPICTNIKASAFSRCYNLISLYLNSVSSVTTLANSNAFSSTPIGGYSTSAGQYGSVYVPASLYSSFLTATNWSIISARIVSV